MLLSSKAYPNPSLLPKSKIKQPETKVYVKWVISEVQELYARKGDHKDQETVFGVVKVGQGRKGSGGGGVQRAVWCCKGVYEDYYSASCYPWMW